MNEYYEPKLTNAVKNVAQLLTLACSCVEQLWMHLLGSLASIGASQFTCDQLNAFCVPLDAQRMQPLLMASEAGR